ARWRTIDDRESRAITGKSSGGFGAMITPMLRPDLFGAFATHAGDTLYELCYIKDFAEAARTLRDSYDGSFDNFWTDFRSRVPFTKPGDGVLVSVYGVAAAFSADDDGTVRLPFEVSTGRLIEPVWQRWLDWDPVRMAPRYAEALRSQRAIYVDAGTRDEYYLDLGAQAFVDELSKIGVTPEFFELFDAGHAATRSASRATAVVASAPCESSRSRSGISSPRRHIVTVQSTMSTVSRSPRMNSRPGTAVRSDMTSPPLSTRGRSCRRWPLSAPARRPVTRPSTGHR